MTRTVTRALYLRRSPCAGARRSRRPAHDVLGWLHADVRRRDAARRSHFDARRIRCWFERFRRLLPNPRFEIERLVISGPLWNQCLASHTVIRSTVDGEPYENQFGHFLRLRWGKVVDDLIIEDTQRWERACRRLIAAGVDEAAAAPMT